AEDYCRVEGVSGCDNRDFHDFGSRTCPALSRAIALGEIDDAASVDRSFSLFCCRGHSTLAGRRCAIPLLARLLWPLQGRASLVHMFLARR
ncbi:hypothetical protein A2U01_0069075, partial [Trifolium medium]|nr:hypothetical protein [Trifolium medium]